MQKKSYLENVLDELDLIENVTPSYKTGRRRNLTDDETEERAYIALSLATNVLENINEALNKKDDRELYKVVRCLYAERSINGGCMGYIETLTRKISEECLKCKEFKK